MTETWLDSFVEILKEHFHQIKESNSRVSLRQFAQKCGCSPGTLSQVLRNKRKISPDRALEMLKRLEISGERYEGLKSKIDLYKTQRGFWGSLDPQMKTKMHEMAVSAFSEADSDLVFAENLVIASSSLALARLKTELSKLIKKFMMESEGSLSKDQAVALSFHILVNKKNDTSAPN